MPGVRPGRRLKMCLLTLALAIAAAVLFFRWFEDLNLYFPSRDLYAIPRSLGMAFEDVALTAADGTRLHAWWIPGPAGAPAVLFCHGNGGNISSRVEKFKLLHQAGLSVLAFDYRGYGKSGGRPSEKGFYADGRAAWTWLTGTKKFPPGRIVLHGESLGGGVATQLASEFPAGALILESAFTNVVEMAHEVMPLLPARLLVTQNYDALAKLPRLRLPVLVLHSPQDDIIPYKMGRHLFEAANAPKRFVDLKGDHNEGFLTSGPLYPAAIRDFLSTQLK